MLLSLRKRIIKMQNKHIKEIIKCYEENFDFEVQMLVDESKTIFDI